MKHTTKFLVTFLFIGLIGLCSLANAAGNHKVKAPDSSGSSSQSAVASDSSGGSDQPNAPSAPDQQANNDAFVEAAKTGARAYPPNVMNSGRDDYVYRATANLDVTQLLSCLTANGASMSEVLIVENEGASDSGNQFEIRYRFDVDNPTITVYGLTAHRGEFTNRVTQVCKAWNSLDPKRPNEPTLRGNIGTKESLKIVIGLNANNLNDMREHGSLKASLEKNFSGSILNLYQLLGNGPIWRGFNSIPSATEPTMPVYASLPEPTWNAADSIRR